MKKVFILPVFALALLFAAPSSSYALSCMDPEGSTKYFIEDAGTVIVTATPKQNKEHVKEKATKDDPNMMYDSGFTAQLIEVSKAHKGNAPDSQWVYFQRDATWNYLCAGGPATIGEEQVYVISKGPSLFDVTGVVAVYPADSQIAKDIIKAAVKANDAAEHPETPEVFETDKAYWLTQLHDELKDMAFLIKVKLAEWNFWKTTK
jgi:hypothetical protein